MTPKEKARELINRFKDKVNPYVGGHTLSNIQEDEIILWQSKRCALEVCNEIISIGFWKTSAQKNPTAFYSEVREELEKL